MAVTAAKSGATPCLSELDNANFPIESTQAAARRIAITSGENNSRFQASLASNREVSECSLGLFYPSYFDLLESKT
jgi:hypothetical protein